MNPRATLHRRPFAGNNPGGRTPGELWAIVLAGGEGVRLRPLTRRLYGDERPKQYAALTDSRSLLRQTLDRVVLRIPLKRTVVVTLQKHAMYATAEFARLPRVRVLIQPEDRGTAAGVLFPAHWIHWRDPTAIVAVFPSDHFILEEGAFMDHVMEVATFVGRHPERLVLLGARPTGPETEYGWIEPAEPIGCNGGESVFRVRRFWEKPSEDAADTCFAGGCFWNSFVLVARVTTLVEAGRWSLPDLTDRLARIEPFAGSKEESPAVQQAYASTPAADFSRAVLEPCPAFLAVSPLPALTWCDLGTPDRVLRTLRRTGISPHWLSEMDGSAVLPA